MKARYFEVEHFLASGLGPRPSFVWRSILHGRELLLKGLQRTIGDGRETLALSANWIWDDGPRRPVCASAVADPLLRVVDLIDRDTYTWKSELVHDLFSPQDASYILNLRISRHARDSFVWGFTPHGRYTSQSGYKVLRSSIPSSTPPLEKALWKKLWKLKSEPKIRHFLWKCLSGALPVADRLQTRQVNVPSVCLRCSSSNETICHMLFTCPSSKQIWESSGITLPQAGFSLNSVFLNIHYLVSTLSRKPECPLIASFPWILWEVWKSRNALVFEKSRVADQIVLRKGLEAATNFFDATHSSATHPAYTPIRWSPPPSGFTKCNAASSWSTPTAIVGLAWLLRDEFGNTVQHGRHSSVSASFKLEAKLLSLLWAAESLATMRRSNVVFETTSSLATQAITKPWLFPIHRLLLQSIFMALSRIHNWLVVSCHSSANQLSTRITSSATSPGRQHSYIQAQAPSWLAADIVLEAVFL